MIVVLADDLSGAAELAGVAWQHGLTAEVQTVFHPATDAGVVCLDTNTRLLPETEAAALVAATARAVHAARPAWIYKKCDSVLRGPVLAEARSVARVLGQKHILLLPANPTRQRVIRDGIYHVGHQPLHETVFAHDPSHPRVTSRVRDLLGRDLAGVTVPDTPACSDLLHHAATLDAHTLPVGAADFFSALLECRVPREPPVAAVAPAPGPVLLVCGSTASWNRRRAAAETAGIPVFVLPHESAGIAAALRSAGRALLGLGRTVPQDTIPSTLADGLARSVGTVLQKSAVARLMIEGGATAASILHGSEWTRLRVTNATGGVATLQPVGAAGPQLLIKPGSYPWPPELWPDG